MLITFNLYIVFTYTNGSCRTFSFMDSSFIILPLSCIPIIILSMLTLSFPQAMLGSVACMASVKKLITEKCYFFSPSEEANNRKMLFLYCIKKVALEVIEIISLPPSFGKWHSAHFLKGNSLHLYYFDFTHTKQRSQAMFTTGEPDE